MLFGEYRQIVSLAASSRLPAMYQAREFVDAGGLMSYGPNLPDLFRRTATYVDKILKGAKPADLPVEQPTKFVDLGWLDALTALVDQRNSNSLTIRRRAERERRPAMSDPFVAPFGHREEWQAEPRAHLRQRILNAGALTLLTIFALRHDSALDEAC